MATSGIISQGMTVSRNRINILIPFAFYTNELESFNILTNFSAKKCYDLITVKETLTNEYVWNKREF